MWNRFHITGLCFFYLQLEMFMRALLAVFALGMVLFGAHDAAAQNLKKVRFALGITTPNVAYPNITLPMSLGYWKDEGLDVELIGAGSTLQAVQQVVGGNAEFLEGNAAGVLQAISKNKLPLRVLSVYGVNDWSFVVPPDSDIKDAKSMVGKKIGMLSLASGAVPTLKAYLAKNNVNPNSVDIIPVGTGAAPIEALRANRVDALLYWPSAVAQFENVGLKFKTFTPPEWKSEPDYLLGAAQSFSKSDPQVAVGMARGMAKAVLFAQTNPDCALKVHWKNSPSTRSKASDEKTSLAWDMNLLQAKLKGYTAAAKLSDLWGKVDDVAWKEYQAFLLQTQQINTVMTPNEFLVDIPDFHKQVNNFDRQAVIKAAQSCSVL